MSRLFLRDIESFDPAGPRGEAIRRATREGEPVPGISRLIAFKPDRTDHLCVFTEGVMRGPSPLSPGFRELIAAFTSHRNDCPF